MKTIYLILILSLLSFISCKKESTELFDSDIKFVPTDVTVRTNGYFTIDKVFDFINSFDHSVESIKNGIYTSDLPPDSLKYVLDYLNAKPYTHSGIWHVTGYIHYQTRQITIFPSLFQIRNKEYQADWLQTIAKLKLVEDTTSEVSGSTIYFHVPEGKEKEWVLKFEEYDFVKWADLNQIIEMEY